MPAPDSIYKLVNNHYAQSKPEFLCCVVCRHHLQVFWTTKETLICCQVSSAGLLFARKSMRVCDCHSQLDLPPIDLCLAGVSKAVNPPQSLSDGARSEQKVKQQAMSQTADFIASHSPTSLSKAQAVCNCQQKFFCILCIVRGSHKWHVFWCAASS